MDKFQNCPACNETWDGGEIIDSLRKMETFMYKDSDFLVGVAESFGWTPKNHKHFTNVIMHTINDNLILECPHCHKAFEDSTGMEFNDMYEAKEIMP